jgi:hypothetical protein
MQRLLAALPRLASLDFTRSAYGAFPSPPRPAAHLGACFTSLARLTLADIHTQLWSR